MSPGMIDRVAVVAERIDATPLLAGDLREQVLAENAAQLLPSLASTVRP
jgi:hypothetical protein